jgi:NAD+ synthetase
MFMQVYNAQDHTELGFELLSCLEDERIKRNFDPKVYVEAKGIVLNDYLRKFNLKSCVVAVSGGIDSAVVLGIVKSASLMKDSPIKKIIAVCLPVFNSNGVINQNVAKIRGEEVSRHFGIDPKTIDLSATHALLKSVVDSALELNGEDWANGQLVPYLRTPTLYYITSLLSQSNIPGVICGTTNKDEGAYLGYFGKASDGMVDLQLISDIHKSEVFQLGAYLGVPESIMKAKPTGDMYDGRSDVEVFGTSYDFVELYLKYLEKSSEAQLEFKKILSKKSLAQFQELGERLENMHQYNKHKYLAASPAVHLDLYQTLIPDGWVTNANQKRIEIPDKTKFVGNFDLNPTVIDEIESNGSDATIEELSGYENSFLKIKNLLNKDECERLKSELLIQNWIPVGLDGMKSDFDPNVSQVGSYRVSTYASHLADILWQRISVQFPKLRIMKDDTPTDWNGSRVWEAQGVSPLFRFIRYKKGGLLVPHYDAPFEYDAQTKTLMSVVIYLTQTDKSGKTRLIKDKQTSLALSDRIYEDWKTPAKDNDVLLNLTFNEGDAIAFDHRILHDSEGLVEDEDKLIIRTDIVFKKCSL